MAKYEDYFHVMLALASLAHYAVVASPGTPLPGLAFLHIGRAMSKLRHRLASPDARPDDGVILTILQLAMFERGLGNDVASKAHKVQVNQMVASRGGIDHLGLKSSVRATLTM
ncbi:uncharacterized protein A1O5_03760 [Cladophialophora psammophila CBS 110553]|uniref:Transcription factor domain-containing protein n=1 Tax=Cladophialophora psammophila CBS 110553 TaxID=1182543 RepID=W9XQK7_9EURO|nr:uncharacterized protein A1O5_03760 [Cladophialophora psammophila CBS 110553]EXJ72614.1 hypothetical protein A1O5_03760 [Cladophialophora psammophila CBS 110553]